MVARKYVAIVLIRHKTGSRLRVDLEEPMIKMEWVNYASIRYPGWEIERFIKSNIGMRRKSK